MFYIIDSSSNVVDLRDRLESTCDLARQELAKASKRHKQYYDTRTRDRKFEVGDKVLMLLPTDKNKLKMQWKGPFVVVNKVAKHDYRIVVKGKEKTFHANLLKKYVSRNATSDHDNNEVVHAAAGLVRASASIVEEEEELMEIVLPPVEQTQTYKDVTICDDRSKIEQDEVFELMQEYADVLNDLPGRTTLLEHTVKLTSTDPVRSKAYPVLDRQPRALWLKERGTNI